MNEKEAKQFYNSSKWKRKRIEILRRDFFECQDCRKRLRDAFENGIVLSAYDSKIRRAECVHHVKELRDYPELALDDDNLISLCAECHNKRHGRNSKIFLKKSKTKKVSEEKW